MRYDGELGRLPLQLTRQSTAWECCGSLRLSRARVVLYPHGTSLAETTVRAAELSQEISVSFCPEDM